MKNLALATGNFLRDEEGVTAIEYGLIAALIAVACITAITLVGTNLQTMFAAVSSALVPVTAP